MALIEYIAHLSTEDWRGVSRDLVSLGFLPEGMRSAVENSTEMADVMQHVMGRSLFQYCSLFRDSLLLLCSSVSFHIVNFGFFVLLPHTLVRLRLLLLHHHVP